MKAIPALFLLCVLALTTRAQQAAANARINELERKLEQATRQIDQLKDTVQTLRAEIDLIKDQATQQATDNNNPSQPRVDDVSSAFVERIIEPELGANERAETIRAKPEIFVQARYSALPIRDANSEFEPNFSLTRIETRWAGRVADRLGAGVEIQFHPAIDGSPEELVNDAFLEYYLNDHTTVRVGQFIKPFGFDIQQSSRNVRAFNFGFFRPIGELSRLSFDYQFKNRPSFNDDAVNGRLNLTWAIEF